MNGGWFRAKKGGGQGSGFLNLGCGNCFHRDWVNVDFAACADGVLKHDLRTPLPFGDSTFSVIYHSHVLEHFARADARRFLSECHRVLKPGGIHRVVVPDLETIARLYLKNLEGAISGDLQCAERYEWSTLELLDQLVRRESGGEIGEYWARNPMPAEDFVIERTGREVLKFLEAIRKPGAKTPRPKKSPTPGEIVKFREAGEVHQWMYDRYSLGLLLAETGFIDVQVCSADQSKIPEFSKYGLDRHEGGSIRKPDSLFVEAVKP